MGRMNREIAGSRHLQRALDAVAAMGVSGVVVVPELPNPCMIDAGARAGDVSKETAARIYRAMIDDDGGADRPA